jgi:aminobenzoyl-glutamate utilization protein A
MRKSNQSKDTIAEYLEDITVEAVQLRRDLHQHPELGWCEFYTTVTLRRYLEAMGMDALVWGADLYREVERLGVPEQDALALAARRAAELGVSGEELEAMSGGQTGLVAIIEGRNPGPTIALRCDIDALPIMESAGLDHLPSSAGFRSQYPGIMHSCGHDGHAAIGIGVASLLDRFREELHGRVKLIFQPAEEGTRGAAALVEAGWLDDVDYFLGLHISGSSGLDTGSVAPGVYNMLATIKFDVYFRGRSAHFALAPHEGRNALTAACNVALMTHAIPRQPGTRSLINVGRIESGTARNVVPGEAKLLMEVRAEKDEVAAALMEQAERLIKGVGNSLEIETEIVKVGYSNAADSDLAMIEMVAKASGERGGLEVFDVIPFEASDDAAVMMRYVQQSGGQATYMKIGAALASRNHTPEFDFDEDALPIAIDVITRTILMLGHDPP